jgi:polar amino acid transport system substrate-binding protein
MRFRYFAAVVCCAPVLAGPPADAQPSQIDQRVADIVQAGKLRIGVFPSFQYTKDEATGKPRGLALEIANTIATRMGVKEVVPVEYPSPLQVIACVKAGECHVGFMLIDPARANEVDFTPAFVRSDFTYLVPPGSAIASAKEVDRKGVRIAVVRGHASTLALARMVKEAQLVYADTYDPTFDIVRSGNAEAFASIREVLIQYSSRLPGSRVLGDSYQINLAGAAIPMGASGRLSYFKDALDEMKKSGAMKRLIEQAGLRGVEVASSDQEKSHP